jgi:integrase
LAVVRINGHDHYLGRYDSPESWEKYNRLILSWRFADRTSVPELSGHEANITVNEIILAFLRHADAYYRRPDGTPTGEHQNFVHAVRPLKRLFGQSLACEFGPKSLKIIQQAMLADGLCRNVINQRVKKIVRVFKWAVENELVPASVHHGLSAVSSLRKGRSAARETEPVKPVPESFVDAVRPYVSRQVWAMIELQRLTAMRPGEVTTMRTQDLDTAGRVWTYTPHRHKSEHHDKDRTIYLGPKTQAILRTWLRTDLNAYLFSPREADAELREKKRVNRKSPLTPSQKARKPKLKPKRTPGEFYATRAYAHAINRACKKAGVPVWGPNRLRHNAATLIRKEFGLEVARAVLGHSDAVTTTIYAERDRALSLAAMEKVG